jgi:hypothetical protein
MFKHIDAKEFFKEEEERIQTLVSERLADPDNVLDESVIRVACESGRFKASLNQFIFERNLLLAKCNALMESSK